MYKLFYIFLFVSISFFIMTMAPSSLAAPPPLEELPVIPVESNPVTSTGTPTSGCQEVPLPNLPFTDGVDPCSSPAAYIRYWFYFSLYLAGIAALLALVLAGAWRVFFATSPSSVSKSNQWALNAVLGLILLFGSWLLLRTLGGSNLTTIRDISLPDLPNPGVILQNGKAGQACDTEGPSLQGSCATGLECINGICKLPACGSIQCPTVALGECGIGSSATCCEKSDTNGDGIKDACVYKNP